MKITSSSFSDGGAIDARFAMKAIAGGKNVSPDIKISGVPNKARSLAITFVDRHPMARSWIHWLAISVPPATAEIPEGASLRAMPAGTVELANTFGDRGYGGPQPPRGSGVHRYELTVYALSDAPAARGHEYTEREFIELVKGKILAKASITGGFENR